MTYSAKVKLIYINDTPPQYSETFPGILNEHTITIEAPAQDLNVHQYFALFKSFLRAIDFTEYNIMDGACGVAFGEFNTEDNMKKLMEEYDLQDKQHYSDSDFCAMEAMETEIRDLKAKLSRIENPGNPNYTDEEMDAMMQWNGMDAMMPWGGLVPGSDEAVKRGCRCPILDNQEMPDGRKWVNGDCPIHGKKK
jgi:hypothetical protein